MLGYGVRRVSVTSLLAALTACSEGHESQGASAGDGGGAGASSVVGFEGGQGGSAGNASGDAPGQATGGAASGGGASGTGGSSVACATREVVRFFDTDDLDYSTAALPVPPFEPTTYVTAETFSDGTGSIGTGLSNMNRDGGGVYARRCQGIGFTDTGGGCRFRFSPLNLDFAKYAIEGFAFWARGYEPVSVRVNLADTTSVNVDGSCSVALSCTSDCCNDHYGVDIALDDTWRRYEIRLEDLTRERGNGPPLPFDPSRVFRIEFRGPLDTWFGFDLDDLEFIRCL